MHSSISWNSHRYENIGKAWSTSLWYAIFFVSADQPLIPPFAEPVRRLRAEKNELVTKKGAIAVLGSGAPSPTEKAAKKNVSLRFSNGAATGWQPAARPSPWPTKRATRRSRQRWPTPSELAMRCRSTLNNIFSILWPQCQCSISVCYFS